MAYCKYLHFREHVHDLKYDKLVTVNVSQAQAMQRAGRAGREASGKCYRLYSQEEYNKMLKMPIPEVLRSNLSSVSFMSCIMVI